MRSLLILLACLGAAALLAVLWVRREPGRVLPPAAAEQGPGASADLLAAGEALAPSAAAGQDSGAAERRAVAADPGLDAGAACRVRVVLASSGAPAPEARLWIEEEQVDRARWLQAMERFNDVEPVLQSGFGRELALDAHGEARVPPPPRALCVAAALGDLHGEARLLPDDAQCTVELQAYHALTVLVVDRAGRPLEDAGVVLCWGEHDPWQSHMGWSTDEHGRAWVPKLEGQLWPHGYRGPMRVTLPVVPCEPEYVSFTLEDLPEEPVRLVAGDSGRLVVQLTDAAGVELPLEGFASFEVAIDSAADLPAHLRLSDGVWKRIHAGRAAFEHVGLNLLLDLSAGAEGCDGPFRQVRGPRAAGEEVVVRVPIGARLAVARGRVQGIKAGLEASEPRGAQLSGAVGSVSFQAWLEGDGPFKARVQPHTAALDELAVPWSLLLSGVGGPALTLVATPRVDAQAGALDFGELAFPAPSALVRLRVLGRGKGLEGARVEVGRSATRTLWCDGEGRCALDGAGWSLPIAVRAAHADWLPSEWLEVRAPDGEQALELRAGAALVGRLLLPEGGSDDDFELALRSEAAAAAGDEPLRADLGDGGRFRFAPCEPGPATLAVAYGEVPALERPGIELRAGETTDLGEIELRGALQTFELSFALAGGEPWRDGALVVRELDGSFSLWMPIGDTGRVRFLAQRPRVDLWAVGAGGSATLFEGATSGHHLVLGPAAGARLRLPSGLPRLEPPLALVVRGERRLPETVAWDELDYYAAEGTVGGDGSARLQAPCPGTYELAWYVQRADTEAEFAVQQAEPQTIVVPEPPEEPVFTVLLSAEALARAVAEAGG